jgi:hypothetical protein
MADWKPIKRAGKAEVLDIHPQDPGRLDVVIPLSADPPDEWARHLVGAFAEDIGIRVWYREGLAILPEVQGDSIRIAPIDSELESWIEGIDSRIEEANKFYEEKVLPQIRATEAASNQAFEARRRRLEEARRKAEQL